MKKKEALNQLKSLHYLLEHFQEIESREEDVKALEYAINELERTAHEVPVQEQSIKEMLSKISILLITASSITRKALEIESNFND